MRLDRGMAHTSQRGIRPLVVQLRTIDNCAQSCTSRRGSSLYNSRSFDQGSPKHMDFHIESTSFCPSGIAPRWTWWIKGARGEARYELLGTDEQGAGLYLFRFAGDRSPEREELIDRVRFSIPAVISKADASERLAAALDQIGWRGHTGKK